MDIPQLERDQAIRSYIPGRGIPTLLRDSQGHIYINPLKRYVKPFFLTTEPNEITLAPNGVSNVIPLTIDNKGHFEIIGASFQSERAEAFTVKMLDSASQELLCNRDIHVSTIASGAGCVTNYSVFGPGTSAGRQYRWPDSYWLQVEEKGRAIHAQFRNLSGLSNRIRFTLYGYRWFHTLADQATADQMQGLYLERKKIKPFFYSTDQYVKLAAGEVRQEVVRFTDEVYTEWIKSSRVSTGRFKIRIEERTTRKSLMDELLMDDLVFGPGEFPFMLWESSVYEPNTKMTLALENVFPGDNVIWMTFGCRHISL